MKNRHFDYFDDDSDDSSGRLRPSFQVPWYARIFTSFFSMVDRARFAFDAVIMTCLRIVRMERVIGHFHVVLDRVRFGFSAVVWKCLSTLRLDRVFKPFQMVFAGLRQAFDWILLHTIFSRKSETILETSEGVFKHVRLVAAYGQDRVALWIEKSVVFRWLTFPLRMLVRVAAPFVHFLVFWMSSREYRRLWFGIPAVLMTIPLVMCVVLIPLRSDEVAARQYLAAARKAASAEQFDAARLYYRKVMAFENSSNDAIREVALLAEREGDPQEAYRQMKKLASADEPGLPLAHLWIAHAIATKRIDPHVENPNALMKKHLDHILAINPKNELALRLTAEYYLAIGDTAASIETLGKVDTPNRQSRLSKQFHLAVANRVAGKLKEAENLLVQVTREYAEISAEEKSLEAGDYVVWATAQNLIGNTEHAIAIVETGRKEHPENEALISAQCTLNLALLDSLPTDQNESASRWFEIAKSTLELDPTNETVLIRMAVLAGNPAFASKVKGILQPYLDDDRLSVDAYDRLANSALVRGDNTEAIQLYRAVLSKDPNRIVALNNLAWILSQNEPVDLAGAVKLIEKAITINPSDPFVRSTHGQILIKQGHWAEAIRELEFALNGIPGNRSIHNDLALAYAKLGNEDMAHKHKRMMTFKD